MTTRALQLQQEVTRFHRAHSEVWEHFERFALAKAATHMHYSADAIMHRVRWETESAAEKDFKINNNYVAFYARRFARVHPEHAEFFRMRRQPSAGRILEEGAA